MFPKTLLSALVLAAIAQAATTCNVLNYGGIANNATDVVSIQREICILMID